MDFIYRFDCQTSDLQPGECRIYRDGDSSHPWLLAFCYTRITDGARETRVIPVNPGFEPKGEVGGGPHAHSWGLRWIHHNRWACRPSIHCLDPAPENGGHDVSVWHEVVDVTQVPDGEPWVQEALAAKAST